MTIKCTSEEKIEITNFRVIKAMSLNEFASFWLSSEKMITLLNNRERVINWLLSTYDRNEPVWKEMRKRWDS